ncbi:MAG: hypothetical protein ACE360_10545 [Hyphomicrobiales bacterium]
MKVFINKVRYFALALVLALAVQPVATITSANVVEASDYYSQMPMMMSGGSAGGGSSLNPWPVVLIGTGVASIIACAMIVGAEEGRELTLEEAVHAGLFPLHCLFDLHLNGN